MQISVVAFFDIGKTLLDCTTQGPANLGAAFALHIHIEYRRGLGCGTWRQQEQQANQCGAEALRPRVLRFHYYGYVYTGRGRDMWNSSLP